MCSNEYAIIYHINYLYRKVFIQIYAEKKFLLFGLIKILITKK